MAIVCSACGASIHPSSVIMGRSRGKLYGRKICKKCYLFRHKNFQAVTDGRVIKKNIEHLEELGRKGVCSSCGGTSSLRIDGQANKAYKKAYYGEAFLNLVRKSRLLCANC